MIVIKSDGEGPVIVVLSMSQVEHLKNGKPLAHLGQGAGVIVSATPDPEWILGQLSANNIENVSDICRIVAESQSRPVKEPKRISGSFFTGGG